MLRIVGLVALGLVLLVVAATQVQMRTRSAKAVAAYPPRGSFVQVDGVWIHAEITGTGPDVVLIHGSSGNTRDMTFRLAPMLAERYRVITFDRPGLGHSDRLRGDEGIVAQARVLQAAAAALGAERPIVLGQSYGGAVALAWAVHLPDTLSALVPVSAPSQVWDGPLPTLYQVNSNPLGSMVAVPLISAWVPEDYVKQQVEAIFAPQSAPEGYAAYVGAPLALRPAALRANARQRARLKAEIRQLQPRYPEIAVPMEIVHGTADTTVGFHIHAEPLAEQAPTAHLTLLPGIGHIPQNVAPEDIVAAVDRAARRAALR